MPLRHGRSHRNPRIEHIAAASVGPVLSGQHLERNNYNNLTLPRLTTYTQRAEAEKPYALYSLPRHHYRREKQIPWESG